MNEVLCEMVTEGTPRKSPNQKHTTIDLHMEVLSCFCCLENNQITSVFKCFAPDTCDRTGKSGLSSMPQRSALMSNLRQFTRTAFVSTTRGFIHNSIR